MTDSRYKVQDARYYHFVTCTVLNRLPIFSYPEYSNILLDSLSYLRSNKSMKLMAYVIMPDHIHLIIQHPELPKILRMLKSYTARRIIDHLKDHGRNYMLSKLQSEFTEDEGMNTYQVWKKGYHPIQLSHDDMIHQKLDYIHYNPVKAGFVDKPDHWRYSSARNYMQAEALIDVDLFLQK